MNQNLFSTNFLDRVSFKRNDKIWINAQFKKESTRILPVWASKNLCMSAPKKRPIFLTPSDLHDYPNAIESSILLGISDKKTYFTIDIDSFEYASTLCDKKNGEFLDLRHVAPLFNFQDAALATLAQFMINWSSNNRFCGKCGNPTMVPKQEMYVFAKIVSVNRATFPVWILPSLFLFHQGNIVY